MNSYGWEYEVPWLAQAGPIPKIKGVASVTLKKSMGSVCTRQLYQFCVDRHPSIVSFALTEVIERRRPGHEFHVAQG